MEGWGGPSLCLYLHYTVLYLCVARGGERRVPAQFPAAVRADRLRLLPGELITTSDTDHWSTLTVTVNAIHSDHLQH